MSIRVTVTLDDDVVERLKQRSRAQGISLRQTINDVLRTGLLALERPVSQRKFRVEPKHMGVSPGLNYDNISQVLELGEGDAHR